MQKLKAIVLLVISGLVLVAGLVLYLMNTGGDWQFHLYYKDFNPSRGTVLLLAAVAGVVIFLVCRYVLPAGVRSLRTSMRTKRERQMQQRLTDAAERINAASEAQPPAKDQPQ